MLGKKQEAKKVKKTSSYAVVSSGLSFLFNQASAYMPSFFGPPKDTEMKDDALNNKRKREDNDNGGHPAKKPKK